MAAPASSSRRALASRSSSCGSLYSSTVWPSILWRMSLLPWTSISTVTHWSPWYVFDVLFVQCGVNSLPFMTTLRAGRAEVGGRARVAAVAAEELHFDRDGKILVLGHRLGRLAVEHDAAVAHRPVGPAASLLADEAVLDAEHVVRERLFVEQVAEAVVEWAVVLVVRDFQDAVFDAERVGEVVARFVAFDFRRPAGEVAAIEELNPVAGGFGGAAHCSGAHTVTAAMNALAILNFVMYEVIERVRKPRAAVSSVIRAALVGDFHHFQCFVVAGHVHLERACVVVDIAGDHL